MALILALIPTLILLFEVLKKLRAEVDSVMKCDTITSQEELESLTYLALTFKESLRLCHPGFATSLKRLRVDTKLGSYNIPAGIDVQCDTGLIHMNPKYYPDPAKFNPDRFEGDTTTSGLNSWSYLSLGAGTRHCIGKNFAYQEAHIMLAMIIKRFDFALAPGQDAEVVQEFKPPLLPPAGGIRFTFAPRS